MKRCAAILSCVWALALAPGTARADTESEHARGMSLREQGRHADALDVFRGLYERTKEPRALVRMALAEEALQMWVAAEEHLMLALANRTDPWVHANRSRIEPRLAAVRVRLGYLWVTSDRDGLSVWVAGKRVADLPMREPKRFPSGTYDVSLVDAEGVGIVTPLTVTVAPSPDRPLHIPFPTRRPIATPGPSGAPSVPAVPSAAASNARPAPVEPPTSYLKPLGISALSIGGASALAGAVLFGLAKGNARTFNDAGCYLTGDTATGPDPTRCTRLHDGVRLEQSMGIGLLVAGGALLASGVVMFLLSPKTPADTTKVGCLPAWAGGNVLSLSCVGTF